MGTVTQAVQPHGIDPVILAILHKSNFQATRHRFTVRAEGEAGLCLDQGQPGSPVGPTMNLEQANIAIH